MSRIFGENAVSELIAQAPQAIVRVVVSDRAGPAGLALAERARDAGLIAQTVPAAQLRQRSGGRGGASVAADLRAAPALELSELSAERATPPLVVALDRVTDPHNLGAILRSASGFGADAVIVPKDATAPLNDAAVRASAGAVAYLPLIRVTNLARALRQLADNGLWTVALDADATQPLWSLDLALPTCLVLGAEGRGIRPNVRKACEIGASLPLSGPIGSLNVSVSAGVALAEAARQRRPAS